MAALRKMLGHIEEPTVKELMNIIETQSKQTLAEWSCSYVKEHYLPVYETTCPEDKRLHNAISAVEAHLKGTLTLKELNPIVKEAMLAAREAKDNPIAQAAARAVSTACGVSKTPTNALGFTFYGAATAAYSHAGLSETPEVYDALATKELTTILESLKAAAVADETNPAKIKWGC